MVNKSKFSVVISSGVFSCLSWRVGSLATDTTSVQSPRGLGKLACYLIGRRADKRPFSRKGAAEVRANLFFFSFFFFFGRDGSFSRMRRPTSCQGLLGVSTFLKIYFYFIYFIHSHIFQGYALSPLLFVIAMMPLNHMLRKCTAGCKLSKSQEKINHLMYMDDIKLFSKNEKELENLIHAVRIYSQDIGMEFGIETIGWAR